MSKQMTLYEKAHLIAAAIRLHEHKHGTPPEPEKIAEALGWTTESVHFVINKMEQEGAASVASGSYGVRVLLSDHLKIEELEGKDSDADITDEVEAFKKSQAEKSEKLARMFDKDYKDEAKADLKKDLEEKLADPSKRKAADNPLDAMFKKKE